MTGLGFKRALSDAGVFVHKAANGDIVIAIIYVDDGLFIGPNLALVLKKKTEFMKVWEC